MLGNTEQVTRRSFLQGSLVAAAGLGASSLLACSPQSEKLAETSEGANSAEGVRAEDSEQIFYTPCRANCYQACKMRAHVRDGKITRMSPAPFEGDFELYRGGCIKGNSLAARTYSANRLQYPMRRTGERGSGQWERITWDEAIKDIAENLTRIREQYGDRSVVFDICSGNGGIVQAGGIMGRFANATGMTFPIDSNDHAIGYGCDRVMGCGIWENGNEIRGILDTKLVVIWGSNAVWSHQGQDWRHVAQAQKNGAKLVCIDPQFNITASKCDQFIGIEPGTDIFLAMGLLRATIENDWIDHDFVREQTNAYQLVREDTGKILTTADLDSSVAADVAERCAWDASVNAPVATSQAKDPVLEGEFEASGIKLATCFTKLKERVLEYDYPQIEEMTTISKDVIVQLADEFYHSGCSCIFFGYGPNMYSNGHLVSQAYTIWLSLTGNMGDYGKGMYGLFNRGTISGGAGTVESSGGKSASIDYAFMSDPGNGNAAYTELPKTLLYETFRTQKYRGEDFPLKAIMTFSSNAMSNQCAQNGWFNDVLPNLEYWVVADIEMTDAAEYADIVLPVAFWMETEDVHLDYATPFLAIQEKAIDPLYESRQDLQIVTALAKEMGLDEYFPEVEPEYYLHGMIDIDGLMDMGISLDVLREKKIVRVTPSEEPMIRGLTTPWGTDDALLHIYCEDPAPAIEYGQDWQSLYEQEHLPYWRPATEVYPDNPARKKFPLVFLTDRTRFRTHSQFSNLPSILELDPEPNIRINPVNAEDRGLSDGDMAEVFNDRGHVVAKIRIDNGVRPGCIAMPKGWQRSQFAAGGYQELTQPTSDVFINNYCYYDALCDVRKYEEA